MLRFSIWGGDHLGSASELDWASSELWEALEEEESAPSLILPDLLDGCRPLSGEADLDFEGGALSSLCKFEGFWIRETW